MHAVVYFWNHWKQPNLNYLGPDRLKYSTQISDTMTKKQIIN